MNVVCRYNYQLKNKCNPLNPNKDSSCWIKVRTKVKVKCNPNWSHSLNGPMKACIYK